MLDDLEKMIDGIFLFNDCIECQLILIEKVMRVQLEIVIGRKNVDRKCFTLYLQTCFLISV